MSDNTNAHDAVETLRGNVENIDRMKIAAHLINVFNLAIIKQAGRPQWNEHDMRCFSIALAAIDQIGDEALPTNRIAADATEDMDEELAELVGRNANGKSANRLPKHQFNG